MLIRPGADATQEQSIHGLAKCWDQDESLSKDFKQGNKEIVKIDDWWWSSKVRQTPLEMSLCALGKHRKPAKRERRTDSKRSPNLEPAERAVSSESALVSVASKV